MQKQPRLYSRKVFDLTTNLRSTTEQFPSKGQYTQDNICTRVINKYDSLSWYIYIWELVTLTCIKTTIRRTELIMGQILVQLAFFQDFLPHFKMKASKSSMTQGRGTIFWQLAKNDIPSLENNSASFKNKKKVTP